jgi:hypothetical protein
VPGVAYYVYSRHWKEAVTTEQAAEFYLIHNCPNLWETWYGQLARLGGFIALTLGIPVAMMLYVLRDWM